MNETEIDKHNDDAVVSTKTTERHPTKNKSAPKAPADETKTSTKSSEKKKYSLKNLSAADETKKDKTSDKEDDAQATSTPEQEVPVKPKKKRAPKINESNPTGETVKKKKSKAPKFPPPPVDDEFQIIENSAIDEIQPYIEPKPKEKKSKKSKAPTIKISDSFEDLQVTNLDDISPTDPDVNTNESSEPFPPPPEDNTSEYQKAIMNSYNNLGSKLQFSQYVGDDQWNIVHPPKSARTEPKSGIRKILPGARRNSKPAQQLGSLINRISHGMNTLLRDEKNLVFGEQQMKNVAEFEYEADGVDTDNLHRYAQQLRELEDQDREVNPEFLVLHDGKTVYGVHELDADGKTQLSKRKPIYDRVADQQPDEQTEKKKLLSRLKLPFTRHKEKDEKESKSANSTPDPNSRRKSSRKSLNDDLTTIGHTNP